MLSKAPSEREINPSFTQWQEKNENSKKNNNEIKNKNSEINQRPGQVEHFGKKIFPHYKRNMNH